MSSLYDFTGQLLLAEFSVDSSISNRLETNPRIVTINYNATYSFVITWISFPLAADGSPGAGVMMAALFAENGVSKTSPFQVNMNNDFVQPRQMVAGLVGGLFVVTWTSNSGLSCLGTNIAGQIYNNLGERIGSEFFVNSLSQQSASDPFVAALPSGGFVVSWTSSPSGSFVSPDIYAQVFDSFGAIEGSIFQVNGIGSFSGFFAFEFLMELV